MSPWPTVPLGDVAELNPKADTAPVDEPVSFVPMASVSAEAGVVEGSEPTRYSDVSRGYSPFRSGDLLVAKITPCFENGKIAEATIPTRLGFGSTEFHVVRPSQRADSRYMLHWLRRPVVRVRGEQRMTGSGGQRRVPERFLRDLEIPLPPLEEQRRIAEVLDRADELRAKRKAALALLDTLTQSIFLDMFGDPADPKSRWDRSTLGDNAAFVGGGTPSRAEQRFFEGEICWATSKDFRSDILTDTQEHITSEAIEASATKLVGPGSILVVVKSKVLMHRLPTMVTSVPTCFGQDVKAILPGDRLALWFTRTMISLQQRVLLDRARGANTEGLTLEHLRSLPVVLPPLAAQLEFERRAATVRELAERAQASADASSELFASLQQRAFRGEL